jgi:hypothetical protein
VRAAGSARLICLASWLLACACLPATAHAAQQAKLHVTLKPERLGQTTTLAFNIHIMAPAKSVPSPLTALDIQYPGDLGIATSGLGLATCTQTTLEELSPEHCPADSWIGQGTATGAIPFGPEIITETVEVAIVRAPAQAGQLALLFYASGETPVNAQLVFPGQLTPAGNHGRLHIALPLVPSLPEGPNVAIVALHATLGPPGLTYYERVKGKLISYHPNGILLPNHCPRSGFRFAAALTFEDHSHTSTSTTVHCPYRTRKRSHPAHKPRRRG